jgi:hypothetical protein
MSISKHYRDKAIALTSVGVFLFGCYCITDALVMEYPMPPKTQIVKDWEREIDSLNKHIDYLGIRQMAIESVAIDLSKRLCFVQDSLNREINVRDNFVYSLTKDTWQDYACVWDVSQKYRSWVYFHANYDPTYFKKPLSLRPYQAPAK